MDEFLKVYADANNHPLPGYVNTKNISFYYVGEISGDWFVSADVWGVPATDWVQIDIPGTPFASQGDAVAALNNLVPGVQ